MGALDGRVAIITGAGRGIGREHALLFAAEGAKVVVNDLGATNDGTGADISPAQQVVEEIEAMGGEAIVNGDNVADWEGAQRMINAAVEHFGDLDILVNNAGILRDRVLVNMTEEEWDAVIAVHLKGHFAPTRWAAAYWREQYKAGVRKARNLVHTSSTSGLFANPGQSNYGAAKTGIATFSQIVAKELVRYNVKSNTIAPGARTRAHARHARARGHHDPQGRLVRPVGSGEHLAARRLPRERGVRLHRRDVPRAGRQRHDDRELGPWPGCRPRRPLERGRAHRRARPVGPPDLTWIGPDDLTGRARPGSMTTAR